MGLNTRRRSFCGHGCGGPVLPPNGTHILDHHPVPLSIIGLSIAAEALGLQLLGGVDLTNILYSGGQFFGAEGPTHGLLAFGHLFADLSVIAIGVYQFVR